MRGANGRDRRRSRIRARLQVAGLAVAVIPVSSYMSARKDVEAWLARRLCISTSDPGDAASESTSGEGA